MRFENQICRMVHSSADESGGGFNDEFRLEPAGCSLSVQDCREFVRIARGQSVE